MSLVRVLTLLVNTTGPSLETNIELDVNRLSNVENDIEEDEDEDKDKEVNNSNSDSEGDSNKYKESI